MTLHAHQSSQSRDCDGIYSSGTIYEMTTQEKDDNFPDLAFKDRVLASVVSTHAHGILTVRPEGLDWHEQTEEGYRAIDVRWCEDECGDERSWQRDHTAEAAGY